MPTQFNNFSNFLNEKVVNGKISFWKKLYLYIVSIVLYSTGLCLDTITCKILPKVTKCCQHMQQTNHLKYIDVLKRIQKGDIIIWNHRTMLLDKLIDNFIPSNWKHCCAYIGANYRFKELCYSNKKHYIIVASRCNGVVIRDLSMLFCFERDFRIVRAKQNVLNNTQKELFVQYLMSHIGKPFNSNFETYSSCAKDTIHCTQLIYDSLMAANPASPITKRQVVGIPFIIADIYANDEYFETVYENIKIPSLLDV